MNTQVHGEFRDKLDNVMVTKGLCMTMVVNSIVLLLIELNIFLDELFE